MLNMQGGALNKMLILNHLVRNQLAAHSHTNRDCMQRCILKNVKYSFIMTSGLLTEVYLT